MSINAQSQSGFTFQTPQLEGDVTVFCFTIPGSGGTTGASSISGFYLSHDYQTT